MVFHNPSGPSNLPPVATVSRWLPMAMGGIEHLRHQTWQIEYQLRWPKLVEFVYAICTWTYLDFYRKITQSDATTHTPPTMMVPLSNLCRLRDVRYQIRMSFVGYCSWRASVWIPAASFEIEAALKGQGGCLFARGLSGCQGQKVNIILGQRRTSR